MTTAADFLTQIQNAIGPAITPELTASSNVSDVFEAYNLGIVIQAAVAEGATISYRDVNDGVPTVFVFRTSPGFIFSRRRPYCHAVIDFGGKPSLEAHLGVRVVGRSRVLHECDVAVLWKSEADTCRQLDISPRSSQVLLAIECKHYTTPLPLNLARAFIGLNSDLSLKGGAIFVTNNNSDSLERFLSNKKNVRWEHKVKPASQLEEDRLRNTIQVIFRDFKAKN